MTKIVIFIALVGLIKVASALSCYECKPCAVTGPYDQEKACGDSLLNTTHGAACLKYSYTDPKNKNATIRQCAIGKRKGTKIEFNCTSLVKEFPGTQTYCGLCYDDLCNSGISLKFSFVSLFIVITAYFVVL